MYFWRIDKLKADLRRDTLPQRQQFYYYLAQSLLASIVMIPVSEPNTYDVVSGVVFVLITALGVVYLYHCNAGDRGTQFLERGISIGFVVSIRLLVLLGLPVLVAYYFALELLTVVTYETTLTDVLLFATLEIIVFWRVGSHMKQVADVSVA